MLVFGVASEKEEKEWKRMIWFEKEKEWKMGEDLIWFVLVSFTLSSLYKSDFLLFQSKQF
jgi:hypothetical protein